MFGLLRRLTEVSTHRPKATLACVFIAIMALSSGAQHLVFDSSEDGFFPDDPSVDLLYEIEDEYRATVDFVRLIETVESGDLQEDATWERLARHEAALLAQPDLLLNHVPLFGTQANSGPAGHAMQWMALQDEATAEPWLANLSAAVLRVETSDNDNLTAALGGLMAAAADVPTVEAVTAERLLNWSAEGPTEWLTRMDDGTNLTDEIEGLIGRVSALPGLHPTRAAEVGPAVGMTSGALGPVLGLQSVDFRDLILSCLPSEDRDAPWDSDGPVLITLVIDGEPAAWDVETSDEVNAIIVEHVTTLEADLVERDGEVVRTFSFAQFTEGANASLGAEIGILTSSAFVLLCIILWFNFRSVRDTAYVMVLAVLAIGATYGLSGWLQFAGVEMTFNAAMNSIPVLLLAIGVDYGLHVVARIREEYRDGAPPDAETVRDLDLELRRRAVRHGAIMTSVALAIAIFTDVIGFLSFRLSSLVFLQVFGTVIAIGLLMIYLLSISALPALMLTLPPKRMALEMAVKTEPGRWSTSLARLSDDPLKVAGIAVLLLLPMGVGFMQLEVAFDEREQLNPEVPVVADFILLSDEFAQSPAPIYVVVEGAVFSDEGRAAWNAALDVVETTDGTSSISGLWSTLDAQRAQDPDLDGLLNDVDAGADGAWQALSTWALTNSTGREVTAATLAADGLQTVISFQAETAAWDEVVAFAENTAVALDTAEEGLEGSQELALAGRSLVNAQTTADVASASILSTGIVAGVILVMLVGIHTTRQRNFVRGLSRGVVSWVPLMMVVAWVYGIMGFTGYDINPQTVTIGALALGLGVDYAVHISIRMEEEAEHDPFASEQVWVERSISTTGRAMFGAALTTAGGFSVLNLSSLLPLRLFGQAFVVAITLALLASLVILPAFYRRFLHVEAAMAKAKLGEAEEA